MKKRDHLDAETRAWVSSSGGKGRATKLTSEQRHTIAQLGARTRWAAKRKADALVAARDAALKVT